MKNFQNKTKIIKISIQLRAVARLAFILWAFVLASCLFVVWNSVTRGGNYRENYVAIGGIVEMVFAMIVSLNFFRFFDRLKNGALFDAKTVGHLTHAGQWWLAFWILGFSFGEVGNLWLGTKMALSFGQLFASLAVIFVAWLLKEAQTLQEEQELTV